MFTMIAALFLSGCPCGDKCPCKPLPRLILKAPPKLVYTAAQISKIPVKVITAPMQMQMQPVYMQMQPMRCVNGQCWR